VQGHRGSHDDGRRRWTDERLIEAARLFDEGQSAGVIAIATGESRNAICGVLYRAGKRRAGTASTVVAPKRPRRRRTMKASAAPEAAQAPPPVEPVDLMGLTTNSCRWPLGGRGGLFCGAPITDPSPVSRRSRYCREHQLVASARGGVDGRP
jgi:hypothetical protein